jgi:hypothetical protein
MTKIEGISYKCARNSDGGIFSESLEVKIAVTEREVTGKTAEGKEYTLIAADLLEPDQIDNFADLADQARNVVQEKMADWPVSMAKKAMTTDMARGYIKDKKLWDFCPKCDNRTINYQSREGKPYQKCQRCRIYLNEDGTTKDMPPRQTGYANPQ